uniref:SagB-type dehydrogenase domain-containing protein n=1 Tax=Candidatus Kentrum sp. LFY TaxID=2126342 RepID=A0A450WDF6_9GAMM|nr:MAG: SagB-type dehydrogenase domain-containing protein [Candidatus Kentron sp. LFY]
MNDVTSIRNYHEATKRHFHENAQLLDSLDWKDQPNPFRRFTGAELITLPLQKTDKTARYEDIFVPGKLPAQSLSKESIGKFFEYSLAISGWRQSGSDRWALRINPSSGNLHPTEGYCLLPAINGIYHLPSVYHYAPKEHALERRGEFPQAIWNILPSDIFLVGLSSIRWREAWKYGNRAFRYCQHDCGHAYMALDIAARMLGWRIALLNTIDDQEIAAALGLDRAHEFITNEEESPELFMAVHLKPRKNPVHQSVSGIFFSGVSCGKWFGKANSLSRTHQDWPLIHVADQSTKKTTGMKKSSANQVDDANEDSGTETLTKSFPVYYGPKLSAYQVISKRRSVAKMDKRASSSMSQETFFRMLSRIMESGGNLPWQPNVNLALFVHRVSSLAPGLYILVSHKAMYNPLKRATHGYFRWERPAGCPTNLKLYLLQEGDFTDTASNISCNQNIASDGTFSIGMITRFQSPLDTHGAWFYKRLFWETGMIGQLLYLEAEAAGFSGTGIGCFLDDVMHALLGLQGVEFQSLYHFTVGNRETG